MRLSSKQLSVALGVLAFLGQTGSAWSQAAATGSLRVVSNTPGAEVFVDGEPAGKVNGEIGSLKPGHHAIELRARGFQSKYFDQEIVAGEQRVAQAELEREGLGPADAPIDTQAPQPLPGGPPSGLTPPPPPPSATPGTLKVLSNVTSPDVFVDGAPVGKAPIGLPVAPGQHVLEVRHLGYKDAHLTFTIMSGEEKVMAADLVKLQPPRDTSPITSHRGMSSFSAVTVQPRHFTVDLAVGYVPFGQFRLTAGAIRMGQFGLDLGVELRTTGYLTDGGFHAKFQFVHVDPIAIGLDMFVGGGGGPDHRNDFTFELGIPISLLFGDLVRFTAHPYLQVYTDRNCSSYGDLLSDAKADGLTGDAAGIIKSDRYQGEYRACQAYDSPTANGLPAPTGVKIDSGQNPRNRFVEARVMLQAVLEFALSDQFSLFAMIEGDPVGPRQGLTAKFAAAFPSQDPQIYGRLGLTFKY